jgi:hypothetical protein
MTEDKPDQPDFDALAKDYAKMNYTPVVENPLSNYTLDVAYHTAKNCMERIWKDYVLPVKEELKKKDEEMEGLIEIHHLQCEEVEKELSAVKEENKQLREKAIHTSRMIASFERGMSEYFRMHDYRSMYGLWEQVTKAIENPLPPLWYSKDELYHFLIRESYSKEIAAELSEKWANSYQGAFDKGFEKALRQSELSKKGEPINSELLDKLYNELIHEHNEITNVHGTHFSEEFVGGYNACMRDVALISKGLIERAESTPSESMPIKSLDERGLQRVSESTPLTKPKL